MSSDTRPVPYAFAIMATFMIVTAAFLVAASASHKNAPASVDLIGTDTSRVAVRLAE